MFRFLFWKCKQISAYLIREGIIYIFKHYIYFD